MMFCPDCNADLDGVPVALPCPGCGGSRRSAAVLPEVVRAVVTVPSPTIITESNLSHRRRETVVGSPKGRYVSRVSGSEQTQHYEGRPNQNEENVPDALHRLRDTLNERAGSLLWREHVGHDHVAVDGTLRSADGQEICCQVTRVERGTLAARGGTGKATSHQDNDALAANVVAALESKLKSADPEVILVLDANDAPAYTDDPHVVEIARRTMSERGLLGRWAAVWLVGPTTKRTTRIDPVVRPQLVDDREVPPQSVVADDLGG
jgi:hypothetical protein